MLPDTWGRAWRRVPRPVRIPLVLTIGLTIIGIGIALLVLPGPGIAVIIVGLALLATEFAWARSLLERGKHHSRRAYQSVRNGISRNNGTPRQSSSPED